MQQVFFDLYQLLQICDENDIELEAARTYLERAKSEVGRIRISQAYSATNELKNTINNLTVVWQLRRCLVISNFLKRYFSDLNMVIHQFRLIPDSFFRNRQKAK